MHYNNVNTSRVGAYAALKKYFKVSTKDWWGVCNNIGIDLLVSVADLRAAISGCAIKVWNVTGIFFAGVVQSISNYALVKDREQTLLLDEPNLCRLNCSGAFSTTLGLPCLRKIDVRRLSGGVSISMTLSASAHSPNRIIILFINLASDSENIYWKRGYRRSSRVNAINVSLPDSCIITWLPISS